MMIIIIIIIINAFLKKIYSFEITINILFLLKYCKRTLNLKHLFVCLMVITVVILSWTELYQTQFSLSSKKVECRRRDFHFFPSHFWIWKLTIKIACEHETDVRGIQSEECQRCKKLAAVVIPCIICCWQTQPWHFI